MDKTWHIASRELAAFFNTWMGYVIVAAALVIDGLLFNAFAVGNEPKLSAEVLADFFYFASGMSMVAGIFLAMRLMAEEKQNGTIALLYSSPVSERQVIYGKFLSALLFSMILQVASLYMPGLVMVHGKISGGHLGRLPLSDAARGHYNLSHAVRINTRAKPTGGRSRRRVRHRDSADSLDASESRRSAVQGYFWMAFHPQ